MSMLYKTPVTATKQQGPPHLVGEANELAPAIPDSRDDEGTSFSVDDGATRDYPGGKPQPQPQPSPTPMQRQCQNNRRACIAVPLMLLVFVSFLVLGYELGHMIHYQGGRAEARGWLVQYLWREKTSSLTILLAYFTCFIACRYGLGWLLPSHTVEDEDRTISRPPSNVGLAKKKSKRGLKSSMSTVLLMVALFCVPTFVRLYSLTSGKASAYETSTSMLLPATATQNRLLQEGAKRVTNQVDETNAATAAKGKGDNNPRNKRSRQKRIAVKDDNSIWAKPEGWKKYGYWKIRKHFGCKEYAHDQTKPLLGLDEWKIFQSAYKQYVNESATFDDTVLPMDGYTFLENENGEAQPPPYHAKQSKGKGRGIFASHDIRKGTLVHDGSKSDLMFPTGMAWRRLVFSLPHNRACDQIDWTWTQRHNGRLRIFSAINISILFNTGRPDKINIQPELATSSKFSTSSKFYATRDIKAGEELLYDYEIYETVWHKVGL